MSVSDIWAASNGNQARQSSIHHWVRYECKNYQLYYHIAQYISLSVFSCLNICFLGWFWCSFGLQRAWKTTSASGRTNSKEWTLNAAFYALSVLVKWISSQEEEGDPSSYADMDMGFRVSRCCCVRDKHMSPWQLWQFELVKLLIWFLH